MAKSLDDFIAELKGLQAVFDIIVPQIQIALNNDPAKKLWCSIYEMSTKAGEPHIRAYERAEVAVQDFKRSLTLK